MKTESAIEQKLKDALKPTYLEVFNESHQHNVPAGSETHFKVTVVSRSFEGRPLMERHRELYALLEEAQKNGVHALSLHAFTPSEWQAREKKPLTSPPCLGGSKS